MLTPKALLVSITLSMAPAAFADDAFQMPPAVAVPFTQGTGPGADNVAPSTCDGNNTIKWFQDWRQRKREEFLLKVLGDNATGHLNAFDTKNPSDSRTALLTPPLPDGKSVLKDSVHCIGNRAAVTITYVSPTQENGPGRSGKHPGGDYFKVQCLAQANGKLAYVFAWDLWSPYPKDSEGDQKISDFVNKQHCAGGNQWFLDKVMAPSLIPAIPDYHSNIDPARPIDKDFFVKAILPKHPALKDVIDSDDLTVLSSSTISTVAKKKPKVDVGDSETDDSETVVHQNKLCDIANNPYCHESSNAQ